MSQLAIMFVSVSICVCLSQHIIIMSYAQARMLVHEKALMTKSNKPLHPRVSATPPAGPGQEPVEGSGGSNSFVEPSSKRSRIESPLTNCVLFDEERIVSAL